MLCQFYVQNIIIDTFFTWAYSIEDIEILNWG